MTKLDIGIVGLSVMGRSLALNMADHGFKVGGYNRSAAVTEQVMKEHPHQNLTPFYDLNGLIPLPGRRHFRRGGRGPFRPVHHAGGQQGRL